MKWMWATFIAISVLISMPAFAQVPAKCEGPTELCQQVVQLQKQLDDQKAAAIQANNALGGSEKKHQTHMVWTAGTAATIAIALKAIVSAAKAWTSWLKTDKQKAVMKIGLLVLGFGAFILTNIGFGLPWWEALIVAGGPPGAVLVHELMDLIAVLRGTKDLPPEKPGPASPGNDGAAAV